jgi:DNA-binding CsgD family transcriptional regulator/signal transduction histidine kinase
VFDELSALDAGADLSCCELGESAEIVHRWLRQHCSHEAIAISVDGSGTPLSQWASPRLALGSGPDRSSAAAAGDLDGTVVTVTGVAASCHVTMVVVLTEGTAPCSRVERALRGLALVLAARIGSPPSGDDTAQLALAHAVAAERDRVTQELTDRFAQYLHTIAGHLGDGLASYSRARVELCTSVASRALVELREGRGRDWRDARRVDEAFGAIDRGLGELARAAGIPLECSLTGRRELSVPGIVLDVAGVITRAAMLNVVEHSGAERARVEWRAEEDELMVSIVDDGSGFDARHVIDGNLSALRRRAESLGGSLQVESVPGWGTRVQARLRLLVDDAAPVDESASALIGGLGDRELDVLRQIALGRRNREIAAELFLSQHTVKFHLGNIFEKLGVRTRAEAAAVAFAAGIHPGPAAPAPTLAAA